MCGTTIFKTGFVYTIYRPWFFSVFLLFILCDYTVFLHCLNFYMKMSMMTFSFKYPLLSFFASLEITMTSCNVYKQEVRTVRTVCLFICSVDMRCVQSVVVYLAGQISVLHSTTSEGLGTE